MGVSYAPPAYYADRLCERGRYVLKPHVILSFPRLTLPSCYLRDFYAPAPDSKVLNHQRAFKRSQEETFKGRRSKKFNAASRPLDRNNKPRKTKEEKAQETHDKEEVEKLVRKKAFTMARDEFYLGQKIKNPWKEALGETMFWM